MHARDYTMDNDITIVAQIVAAYVSNNSVASADLPKLIGEIHAAVGRLANPEAPVIEERLQPAVAVKKSVTPDFIICLEDGKKFKSLKRHLATVFDMTPDEYRTKWSLPPDYPMVAPNYAAQRSALAKQSGLGQLRKRSGSAAGQ
jgi:predicted transcriptional regulator